jgi:hypothetical protein
MRANLKFPCWLVLAIGIMMTVYFAKNMRSSWLFVLGPWALLPYLVLFFSLRRARSLAASAVVLVAALGVVCYGFWVYFDRTFVHVSSIELSPIEVPFEQLLAGIASWVIVRWLSHRTPNDEPIV